MSLTDRNVRTPGTLPTLGSANSSYTDAIFGSPVLRVTDAAFTTDLGGTNVSFHTSASGYQREWNIDSTKFWVQSSDGWIYLVSFNAAAFTCARVGVGLLAVGDIAWSDSNPNILYGVTQTSPNRTLIQLDASTTPPTITNIVNLDTLVSGLSGNVGALSVANGNLFCIFGASQDTHMHVLWYPLASPSSLKLLHTLTDGRIAVPFGMHSAQIDHTGRTMSLIPWGGTVGAAPVYFWDTTADTVTAGTGANSGHEVLGAMNRINNDTNSGTYDSRKWVYTPNLATPNSGKSNVPVSNFLSPVVGGWGADHSCWHNANASNQTPPFVSGSYRYGDGPGYANSPGSGLGPVLDHTPDSPSTLTPWRPWDDEIIQISVDGSDVVYRHCHTRNWLWRNVPTYEPSSGSDIFYYTPRPNISPDGNYILFNSNMEKTLGTEAGTGIRRSDVFLVKLSFDSQRDARVRNLRAGRGGRSFAR